MHFPETVTAISETRIILRPSTPEDREFLYRVYASTRLEELAVTGWPPETIDQFLRMQFHAQDTDYRKNAPNASFDVILADAVPAGRLYTDRRPGDLRIMDISLLPEFRGRGIGTSLLTALLEEGRSRDFKVSIHVEIHNPAQRLYQRLGFRTVAEYGIYRLMETGCEESD